MSLLGVVANRQQKTLYQCLEMIRQDYMIELAVINFHQPLRNTIYALFPEVVITINPAEVMVMVASHLGYNHGLTNTYEEIAASTEDGALASCKMGTNHPDIYNHKTQKEAIDSYKQWQSYVPLGVKGFHHVIRKIDFYHQEVFNYFRVRKIVDQINLKR